MDLLEFFSFGQNGIFLYITSFIVILSILVFVHEWGHYIVARMCGVGVEAFSIGFGKEIYGFNDKHGTRWKVCMVPLGGYVKMFGDTDPASTGGSDKIEDPKTGKMRKMTKEEKDAAFFSKPVWKRALVVAAGPGINYLFAILLLMGLYVFNGKPITPAVGAAVIEGSAAENAGFEPHDVIVKIDGKDMNSFEDLRREMLVALDTEKHFVIDRGGEIVEIYAKPEKKESEDRFGFKHSRGQLGLISPQHAISIATIHAIDGVEVDGEDEARKVLLDKMGQTYLLQVTRGDEIDGMIVNPLAEHNDALLDSESEAFGILMISDTEANEFLKFPVMKAFGEAASETVNITFGTLEALGQMFTGTRSVTELGGIVRIGAVAGDMASQGFIAIVLFTALLSINLGLINLFPIPVLDGGHLVFYALESVLGEPVSPKVQDYAFQAGFIFLIGVMLFTNLNDLFQLFS